MLKHVLVTGGAGFIGSNLVRHLLRETEHRVVNLDALTYAGSLESLGDARDDPRHVFVHADIGDGPAVDRVLAEHRPTAVVHLAAETHVDRSIDGPAAFVLTNVMGTFRLLQAALRFWRSLSPEERLTFRFVHVSTDEVYGSLGETGTFDETSPYAPSSPYAASKAAADHLARAFHKTYGLPLILVHPSNNYGPRQFPEKLIPLILSRALREQDLPIYGDGQNVRDWLYVEDHCEALRRIAESGRAGASYHVGGRAEKTNLEVVHALCDLLDELRPRANGASYRERIAFVPDRPGHDRRYAMDTSKTERELGWAPAETFESGLRRTVAWYLDNPAWTQRILDNVYRSGRLGLEGAEP